MCAGRRPHTGDLDRVVAVIHRFPDETQLERAPRGGETLSNQLGQVGSTHTKCVEIP